MPPEMPLDSYPNMDPTDESTQQFIEDRLRIAKAQHKAVADNEAAKQAVPREIGGPEALVPKNPAQGSWENQKSQGKQFGGGLQGTGGGSAGESYQGPMTDSETVYDSSRGGQKPSAFDQYADIGQAKKDLDPRVEELAKAAPELGNMLGKAAAQNKSDLQVAQQADKPFRSKKTGKEYTEEEMTQLMHSDPTEYHSALVGGLDKAVHRMATEAEANGVKVGSPHAGPGQKSGEAMKPSPSTPSGYVSHSGGGSSAPASHPQEHLSSGPAAEGGAAPGVVSGQSWDAQKTSGRGVNEKQFRQIISNPRHPEGPATTGDIVSSGLKGLGQGGIQGLNELGQPFSDPVGAAKAAGDFFNPINAIRHPIDHVNQAAEMSGLAPLVRMMGRGYEELVDDSKNRQTRPASLQKQVTEDAGQSLGKDAVLAAPAIIGEARAAGKAGVRNVVSKAQAGLDAEAVATKSNEARGRAAAQVINDKYGPQPGIKIDKKVGAQRSSAPTEAPKASKPNLPPDAARQANRPGGGKFGNDANAVDAAKNTFFGKDMSQPKTLTGVKVLENKKPPAALPAAGESSAPKPKAAPKPAAKEPTPPGKPQKSTRKGGQSFGPHLPIGETITP